MFIASRAGGGSSVKVDSPFSDAASAMLTPPLSDVGAWLSIGSPRDPPYMPAADMFPNGEPGVHDASTAKPSNAHNIAAVCIDKGTPASPIAGVILRR